MPSEGWMDKQETKGRYGKTFPKCHNFNEETIYNDSLSQKILNRQGYAYFSTYKF